MSENAINNYPVSSPEVARMFGIGHTPSPKDLPTVGQHLAASAPANLPVATASAPAHVETTRAISFSTSSDTVSNDLQALGAGSTKKGFGQVLKVIAPYLVVFGVGLFLYFFFFSQVNFSSIGSLFSNSIKATSTPKETLLSGLEQQSAASYNKWILTYYFDVTDSKVTDPNTDNSGNGLTNFQKYLLNLNPKAYDTLGLGMADSQALAQGINPSTGAALTDQQKQILDKYFDMEIIMNRLSLESINKQNNSSNININSNNIVVTPTAIVTPPGQNTIPANNQNNDRQAATPTVTPAPQSNGGARDSNNTAASTFGIQTASAQTISASSMMADLNIDFSKPGRLEIPTLKVNAPLIWSKDPTNFDKDLESGVIHYPGTAVPGQVGTTYISGHSSNYVWAKGDYNHVFTHLNDLPDNGSFKITVVQQNGKDAVLYYVVTGRKEYLPNDQAQFQNGGKSIVALSTCWPVGSTAKRLVLFGELTQVQK